MKRPKHSDSLSEKTLAEWLKSHLPEVWLGVQLPVPGTRKRWDVALQDRAGQITVVEYDGDLHYTNSLKVKADRSKDAIAQRLGHRVIRFPYWLQLDSRTVRQFFNVHLHAELRFPHGFITTEWFPASFCELGLERFERELSGLEETVRHEVIQSLRDRAVDHGLEYVVPKTLLHLL